MRKSCERCKRHDEYHYWNMDGQDECFFKIMIGDFHHEMTIPDKFVQRFGGKISGTVKLEARNGSTCNVRVQRYADKLMLKSGWETFVNTHDIKRGDFLVFGYKGNSQFNVLIFDPSGCEKEDSWVMMNNAPPVLEVHDVPSYIFGRMTHLTRARKKQVEEKVRAIRSDIPIFVINMKKSSVNRRSCTLNFSKQYAEGYLPQEKRNVRLQRDGKRWKVWFDTRPGVARLVRGWRRFLDDNNVKMGDTCLFQLLKGEKKFAMNVHIIRARG